MSGEQQEDIQENQAEAPVSPQDVEKMEEAKLKAKYPSAPGRGCHSSFLQKRLSKGQKFFDSGDYQMAKQKLGGLNKPPMKVSIFQTTGEAIPTPETVPMRKTSLAQPSKLATSTSTITMASTPTGHGPNIS